MCNYKRMDIPLFTVQQIFNFVTWCVPTKSIAAVGRKFQIGYQINPSAGNTLLKLAKIINNPKNVKMKLVYVVPVPCRRGKQPIPSSTCISQDP